MGGWVGGWMDGKAGLRIAYSNQKFKLEITDGQALITLSTATATANARKIKQFFTFVQLQVTI